MLLPLGLLFGSLYLLTREEDKPVGPVATMPPELARTVSVDRPLEGGGVARYLRPDVARDLLRALADHALESVEAEDGRAPGAVFRIIPLPEGTPLGSVPSAADAARAMGAEGLVVLCTLSAVLLRAPGEKLLMACRPTDRKLASPGSQWAVLADAPGSPAIVVEEPKAERTGLDFDQDLPTELRRDLALLLTNPDASPADLEAAARTMAPSPTSEGSGEKARYPRTVETLRRRATEIALRDQVRRAANIRPPDATPIAEVGNVPPDGTEVIDVPGVEVPQKAAANRPPEAPPNGAARA